MNIRIILVSIIFTGLISCSKDAPILFKNSESYSNVYIPQAAEGPVTVRAFVLDSVMHYSFNAFYGGSIAPSNDVKVTVKVDPGLVDSFNIENRSSYTLLPSDAYVLDKRTATIPAGSFSSETLNLNIVTTDKFPPFVTFLLPVTLESDNSMVSKKLNTIYFKVTASYAPGNIPRLEVLQLQNDWASVFSFKNGIYEQTTDGHLLRFPYNAINENFDAAIQLNDAGWGSPSIIQWLTPLRDYIWCMGVNGSPIGTAFGYIYVYNFHNTETAITMDGFTGNPTFPGTDMMIPFKNAMIFRYPSENYRLKMFPTKSSVPFQVSGEQFDLGQKWEYRDIFEYGNSLICINAKGDMYQYSLTEDGKVGSPTQVGSGWDIYKKVIAFNSDLIGIDKDNKLWLYHFTPSVFWALK